MSDDAAGVARLLRDRAGREPLHLRVSGTSMRGVITAGSTVTIRASTTPRPGEIWAYVDDDATVVVHRLRTVTASTVVGRGTGNRIDDAPVDRGRLIGRVHGSVDPDGTPHRFSDWDRRRAHARFRAQSGARRLGLRRLARR